MFMIKEKSLVSHGVPTEDRLARSPFTVPRYAVTSNKTAACFACPSMHLNPPVVQTLRLFPGYHKRENSSFVCRTRIEILKSGHRSGRNAAKKCITMPESMLGRSIK
jgi:hypothetical protein